MKIPGMPRDPIFKEVPGYATKSRESRELDDIKPIGIGKDDIKEVGLEVINTKPDHMGRTQSIKISVISDIGTAWEWADTPPKMKKVIKKLFDQCTADQQRTFKSLYGDIHKISKSKLIPAYSMCEGYVLQNRRENK